MPSEAHESGFLDLKPSLESAEVQALLYTLVGWRDDEAQNRAALERATSTYLQDASLKLYGTSLQRRLVGLIGLGTKTSAELEIRHLVVRPVYRALGVGRGLIEAAAAKWRPSRITAETDASAVNFYWRCGFSVRCLGETHPGTERFCCVLEHPTWRLA